MKAKSAAVAPEILRSTVANECLASGGEKLPCLRVAAWRSHGRGVERYVPEPTSLGGEQ